MVKVDNKISKGEDNSSVGEIESDPCIFRNKTECPRGIRRPEQSEVASGIN